jgi:hypothetical protein
VSAITFLGAEVAEKYPVVKTWQAARPSSVDEEKLITAKGPWVPLRDISLANAFPVLQGYKNYVGVGYHANFEDSLGFARIGVTAAYTPSGNLPGNQQGHAEITGEYLGMARGVLVQPLGLLRHLRADEEESKRLCRQSGLRRHDHLGRAAAARSQVRPRLLRQDRYAANAQNVATTFTRLLTGQVGLHYTDVRRSIGASTTRKASPGRS